MEMTAEELKVEGMNRSVRTADEKYPGWSDIAYNYLLEYCARNRGNAFMAEDVRFFAEWYGVPTCHHARAWGGVFTRAKKDGIIRCTGFKMTVSPKSHRTPASLWEAV